MELTAMTSPTSLISGDCWKVSYFSLAFNTDEIWFTSIYLDVTLECTYIRHIIGAQQMSYNDDYDDDDDSFSTMALYKSIYLLTYSDWLVQVTEIIDKMTVTESFEFSFVFNVDKRSILECLCSLLAPLVCVTFYLH